MNGFGGVDRPSLEHSSRSELAMADQELTPDQQDGLVGDLVESLDGMKLDEDDFEALYDQLDADHQREVDDAVRDFADNAVGDPSWRADE
jgi:hypothetical protein